MAEKWQDERTDFAIVEQVRNTGGGSISPANQGDEPNIVGKQILIVDDKSELLHLMRRVLEDEEYQVAIHQNGLDAFATVKATLPDLLILDLVLGNISGKEVLKQIKDDPVTAEIPVIVYTAAVLEAEEVNRLIASDSVYYKGVSLLQKPFELQHLLDMVAQVVNEPVS